MIDWSAIQTVFLDMDGTLLDLHFDNHFWMEYLPSEYAERQGIDLQVAKEELGRRYARVEGTLQWYSVDYWSAELGLDIMALKKDVEHLIALHAGALDFLWAVRLKGKRLALVTNAHPKMLALKMQRTGLDGQIDLLFCAHAFGLPKERVHFWERLQREIDFDPLRTLLVDDSLPVLEAARQYGIHHLIAVLQPDTRRAARKIESFPAISSFGQIMPV
ncbi:MAG: GMP/IMP nucleotidase [Acidobacteria bacterium]|nr:GMP/IMP nucleotidase [Acidobacteriota bacterium]